MSIYTEMIEYIKVHGIAIANPEPDDTGQCCMLGVKSVILEDNDPYNAENIPELTFLSKEKLIAIDYRWLEKSHDDDDWIYSYNDLVIKGDTDKAIALLGEAEEIRKANESV